MNVNAGTPSIPNTGTSSPNTLSKRYLVKLLESTGMNWETVRERHGKWYATARTMQPGRPIRASATNERQALLNLCRRLGLL